MEREKFKSRLGFILISAGCAIGIGNVWRFPYVVGNNGGGCFVLFYILFLVILGLPILTMEFSVGRASQQSISRSFKALEKKGQYWHLHGYVGMAGNYILMMFYTTVAGWMLRYFFDMAKGDFTNATTADVQAHFSDMLNVPSEMIFWTVIVIILGFLVCSLGLQNGVEKIIVIENKANYESMEYDSKVLYLFCHGYFSPKEIRFLQMLMKTAPNEIQCYHWGDMDYGGIQIFLYNEKNIFPNLIPWRMDAPSYKAALENGKGIKLSSGKQKKLETLNASKLEALKQCILENKMEIEQEMLI